MKQSQPSSFRVKVRTIRWAYGFYPHDSICDRLRRKAFKGFASQDSIECPGCNWSKSTVAQPVSAEMAPKSIPMSILGRLGLV